MMALQLEVKSVCLEAFNPSFPGANVPILGQRVQQQQPHQLRHLLGFGILVGPLRAIGAEEDGVDLVEKIRFLGCASPEVPGLDGLSGDLDAKREFSYVGFIIPKVEEQHFRPQLDTPSQGGALGGL